MIDLNSKTPEELAAFIAEAQAQLVAKQNSKRKEVIAQIKELAASIGVTVEIQDGDKKASKRSASSVAAKYRDPANSSNVWTGRGLAPKWMKAYQDAGRNRDEFLI
jgi:DNA-binding protein H-NS